MEVNLGQFRYVFLLESLYGTCTVSLTTLEQSKWKVLYSAALVIVYVTETSIYIYNEMSTDKPEPIPLQVAKAGVLVMPLYSLIMAIVDYKSKISSALNLHAIENELESLNVSVPGKRLFAALNNMSLITNVANQMWKLGSNLFNPQPHLPLTTFITSFQLIGSEMGQGFTLAMFLTKTTLIQRAIKNGFSDIIKRQEESLTSNNEDSRNREQRLMNIIAEATKKWAQLKNLQGSLQDVEKTILHTFWVHIICFRFTVEVTGILGGVPLATMGIIHVPALYVMRMTVAFLCIVFAVMKLKEEKKTPLSVKPWQIGNAGLKPNQLKHQLLANINRSSSPFSCLFFDVNYALLAAVLENAVFVLTTMISVYRNDM